MTFMPGELHIKYSQMPEISKIANQEQQHSNWQYYMHQFSFQREQRLNSQSVTKSPTSSEDGVRTKRDADENKNNYNREHSNKKRLSRDSGRFIDITI